MSISETDQFGYLGKKLYQNIYGTAKGTIRLTLLLRDVEEYCENFHSGGLAIADIGGGGGQFADLCLSAGHRVDYVDKSRKMVEEARQRLHPHGKSITIRHGDFFEQPVLRKKYDIVLMHGSAEWMGDTKKAIKKAANLVHPGGSLSLLVYNRDKHIFKRGVSGQLPAGELSTKSQRLTPQGGLGAVDLVEFVKSLGGGEIVLQSGIRVFFGFFRSVPEDTLTIEDWLTQEIRHYRKPPFSLLGEHTHLIWKRKA